MNIIFYIYNDKSNHTDCVLLASVATLWCHGQNAQAWCFRHRRKSKGFVGLYITGKNTEEADIISKKNMHFACKPPNWAHSFESTNLALHSRFKRTFLLSLTCKSIAFNATEAHSSALSEWKRFMNSRYACLASHWCQREPVHGIACKVDEGLTLFHLIFLLGTLSPVSCHLLGGYTNSACLKGSQISCGLSGLFPRGTPWTCWECRISSSMADSRQELGGRNWPSTCYCVDKSAQAGVGDCMLLRIDFPVFNFQSYLICLSYLISDRSGVWHYIRYYKVQGHT